MYKKKQTAYLREFFKKTKISPCWLISTLKSPNFVVRELSSIFVVRELSSILVFVSLGFEWIFLRRQMRQYMNVMSITAEVQTTMATKIGKLISVTGSAFILWINKNVIYVFINASTYWWFDFLIFKTALPSNQLDLYKIHFSLDI